jgi:hypothetical protein
MKSLCLTSVSLVCLLATAGVSAQASLPFSDVDFTLREGIVRKPLAATLGPSIRRRGNSPPVVKSIEVVGGNTLCSDQAVRIRARAVDPDADEVFHEWGAAESTDLCLSRGGAEALFSASRPGPYEVTLRVRDGNGGEASVSIPLAVRHCSSQDFEPICPGLAVESLGAVQRPIGRCDCGGAGQRPPYALWPRSVLMTRNFKEPPRRDIACPSVGGWKGRFSKQACAQGVPCQIVQVDCAYEFEGAGNPDVESYAALTAVSHEAVMLDQPLVSAMAVASQSGPLDPQTFAMLKSRFRTKLRFVSPAQVLSGLRAGAPLTHVAVIDSAAVAYGDLSQADNFGHGRAVGRIIADLSCSPRDATFGPGAREEPAYCGQFIHNHLALDQITAKHKDRVHGGFFGHLATLDLAINQALDEWLTQAQPTLAPLVMSLGARIQLSLKRASCLGALVVAATGNADRSEDVGAVYPAAWASEPAPDDAECEQLGFLPPPSWPWGASRPNHAPCRALLYAVSGVGDQIAPGETSDILLASSRSGGTAQFAAQALAAVTDEPRHTTKTLSLHPHTALLSGTSMAAAAVSGTVALAWSLNRLLDGHTILNVLRQNIADLGRSFDGNVIAFSNVQAQCMSDDGTRVIAQCDASRVGDWLHGSNQTLSCPSKEFSAADLSFLPPSPAVLAEATFVQVSADDEAAPPNMPTYGLGYVPWLDAPGDPKDPTVDPAPDTPSCADCYFDTRSSRFIGSFAALKSTSGQSMTITSARILIPRITGSVVAHLFGSKAVVKQVPAPNTKFAVYVTGVTLVPGQAGTLITTLKAGVAEIVHSEPFLIK